MRETKACPTMVLGKLIIELIMIIKQKLFTALIIFTFSLIATAQPSTKNSNPKNYHFNINFNTINSGLQDKEFTKEIAENILQNELDRAGIQVRARKSRNLHLSFVIDYVYHVGDAEYRFAHIQTFLRNKSGHSLCDLGQSVWWGGPSGPGQMRSALSSVSRSFIEHCVK